MIRPSMWAALSLVVIGCGAVGTPTRDEPAPGEIVYTAVGDSAAAGIGSRKPCIPFEPCDEGAGYPAVLTRKLRESAGVRFFNMGIPGAVLSPAIEAATGEYGVFVTGNFADDELPELPRDTTLVTIFGGANDVNALARAVQRGAGRNDLDAWVAEQVRAFGRDYTRLVEGVRERAAGARILVLNVPNMALLPFRSADPPEQRRLVEQISEGFAHETNALERLGVTVIDVMCDRRAYDPSLFAADGFHPNDRGYELLAEKLAEAVRGTVEPPAGSCPQMTILRSGAVHS